MSFKSTAALFGLLLGMLWLFGLMLAYKKTSVDESFILTELQSSAKEYEIDKVTIKRQGANKQPEELQFALKDEVWTVRQPDVKQVLRLEGFRVEKLVREVKSARKSDEATVSQTPSSYGLEPPLMTVTLTGRKPKSDQEKSWQLFVGKESADKTIVYVNSSDRPGKVLPVVKSSIDSLFFKDVNTLRSRQIFRFEKDTVKSIILQQGQTMVDMRRDEALNWRFEKPALGFAEFESAASTNKKEGPEDKQPEGGVKSLLSAILSMRIDSEDDFVPAKDINPANFGLEAGKELGRIELGRTAGKDGKEASKEILLLGQRIEAKNQVFARLDGDEGIFKLNSNLLEPVDKALADPGKLRSTDVAFFDAKKVDAVILKYGKDETKIWSGGGDKGLQMQTGTEKPVKASDKAIQNLLEVLQGKREIQKFYDGLDGKKLDVDLGFEAPVAALTVYVDGLDKDAKETDAKDKDGKEKKEKKDAKPSEGPVFKKDVKPAVVLTFGKTEKDTVGVKRVLADGTISRFAVPKAMLDKVAPAEGTLAFLDTALPNYQGEEIASLALQRGTQKLQIVKGRGDQAQRWFFQEATPTTVKSQADVNKTGMLVNTLASLQVKKWLRKIAAGEDLDKYGLAKPALVATLQIKKDRFQAATAASVSMLMGGPAPWAGLLASAAAVASRETDPGDSIVLKIGRETDQDKDKPAYFAQHTGSDFLFLVPADFVRLLRDTDLRDRTSILNAQAFLAVGLWGLAAAEPQASWVFVSPIAGGQIQTFDSEKVKEVDITLRTPFELRTFGFQMDAKDKGWKVKSGLQDFTLDAEKVTQLLKDLGDLKTERFVSLSSQKPEHKLGAKDFQLKFDLVLEDGRKLTVTVGAAFERFGYFGHSSGWSEAVFLLPPGKVEPLFQGPGHFAKERVAGAP